MPSKNVVKIYQKGGYYHVYNRGVAKQKIFKDSQDDKVFLKYLKEALTETKPVQVLFTLQGRTFKGVKKPVKNFQKEISLIAYCLMPNHFHILLKQINKDSMTSFIRSLCTRYACYFNTKYKRVGPLFQGKFKAVLITKDNYLLHLTRYIHLNSSEHIKNLKKAYSSYADYLGLRKTSWVQPSFVLKLFNNPVIPEITKMNNYKSFVERYKKDSRIILGELALE